MIEKQDLTVSVIVPVYNEYETVRDAIQLVLEQGRSDEIIIVDDGSTDGTRDLYPEIEGYSDKIKVFYHDVNKGKGAAVIYGFSQAKSDVFLIQDADLEYDPRDYAALLDPIEHGRADVVYGSRLRGGPTKAMFFWHMVGNKFLTLVTNLLYNAILTDMETCYKVFRREVVEGLNLKSRGFEFEPEITSKVLKRGYRIYEIPISYYGREFEEGKKISPLKDGPRALWALIKYRFVD